MDTKNIMFGGYKGFVFDQIKNLELNEMIKADLACKRKQDFQRTCKRIAEKIGTDYQTRTSLDGNLWVKRTK